MNQYKQYQAIKIERKTGKTVLIIPAINILTEDEAIRMQIDLSTPKHVMMMKEVK